MDEHNNKKVEKKNKPFIYFLSVVFIIVALWFGYTSLVKTRVHDSYDSTSQNKADSAEQKPGKGFIDAVTSDDDTNYSVIHVSSPEGLNAPVIYDTYAGQPVRRVYNGRRLNIALTGLDSRMGTIGNHADANHIISVLLDSGLIEIISIPRDTPAEAGFPDTSNQNKLTIVRAVRGRQAYHAEAAKIAGLDKIHYWAELSFSQAMGLIEWFGFSKPASTLQVLRSRTGLGGDDYQRCYNQAQFIRQMIIRHFDKFTGMLGDVFIRGGLVMVDNNLNANTIKDIISQLEAKGFKNKQNPVTIKIRPPLLIKFKIYDFTDEMIIKQLEGKIERFNESHSGTFTVQEPQTPAHIRAERILNSAINRAVADSAKNPASVIRHLRMLFDQRAWFQVRDLRKRDSIRKQFAQLLASAYKKKKQYDKAQEVQMIIDSEKRMFESRSSAGATYDSMNYYQKNQ